MNGVRRLLGGATLRSHSPPASGSVATDPPPPLPPLQTTLPLSISSSKPTWPPSPLVQASDDIMSGSESSSNSTTGGPPSHPDDSKRSNDGRQRGSMDNSSRPHSAVSSSVSSPPRRPMPSNTSPSKSSTRSSNALAGPSSPSRPLPNRVAQLSQKSMHMHDQNWKQSSGVIDSRNEMLMTLLASEAVVDSRDFLILSAEEVEDLKKEHQVLDARLGAMSKKLKLETKIRDAAASLVKVNAAHKTVSKQSSEQLEAADRKVDTVQKELWRISERSNEIYRKLLEHRAGVLSTSLRNLEAKVAGDTDESGYNASFQSSLMSPTSSETSHASSKAKFEGPHLFAGHENARQPLVPRKPPSTAEYSLLEEKLKDVTAKLKTATDAQSEAKREASHLRLEKVELETSLGMDLQAAEEKIAGMRVEIENFNSLEHQVRDLLTEKDAHEKELEVKQRDVDMLERRLEVMEERSGEALGVEMRTLELESAMDALRSLMRFHGLDVPNDASMAQHVSVLGSHLDEVKSQLDAQVTEREEWDVYRCSLEEEARSGLTKHEALVRELEDARREREEARREVRTMEARLREKPMSPVESFKSFSSLNGDSPPDVKKFIQVLQPVWNALPSPESRASKFGHRAKSPVSAPGSPNTSLAELDVRLLKTLYDGRPAYQVVENSGAFTVESFAARVQALVADDKALIERLIRFAQAHDMLKKNAERAQKLAQESSIALETYQKQVKVLEERNMSLASSVTALQDEIHELQDSIDKVMAEKRDVETQAADQAETCRQLTEANNALSAKTLSLAEEAAAAPEAIRTQLEKQLAECKLELEQAQEHIHAMQSAEQSQNIALLDELNHMQGENENLRVQLRALQAGKK